MHYCKLNSLDKILAFKLSKMHESLIISVGRLIIEAYLVFFHQVHQGVVSKLETLTTKLDIFGNLDCKIIPYFNPC